jgi:Uma2 family endonuclease
MGNPSIAPEERFTYRHYRTWPDSERWELIEGRAWAISPAPTRKHQKIAGRLFSKLHVFLEGHPCEVYQAPFDVLLPAMYEMDDEVDTVVQPDMAVFCDPAKLRDAGARGAPDLVVEILSPGTAKKDLNEKFRLYEKRGVREYWIIDPEAWSVCVYRLLYTGKFDEGELRERLGDDSPIASEVIQGFMIDCRYLFAGFERFTTA